MTLTNKNKEFYLQEIETFLPYGEKMNNELLDYVRDDLIEQKIDGNYHTSYGYPKKVAINISTLHQDHLQSAGWLLRLVAFTIDMLLVLIMGYLVFPLPFVIIGEFEIANKLFIGTFSESDFNIFSLFWRIMLLTYLSLTFFVLISYFFIMEPKFGTTIGKKIFSMRVIDEFGIKITWKQSLVRNFVKIQGEFLPFDILLGWFMRDEEQEGIQRATEIASKTRVVVVR